MFEHTPRVHNKHADALVTLTSKIDIRGEVIDVGIIKRILQPIVADLVLTAITNGQGWRIPLMQKLAQTSSTMVARDLKDFIVVNDELYYRDGDDAMAQTLSMVEAKEVSVHELSCKYNDVSLHTRLQRQGYYWYEMAKEADELQSACPQCQEPLDIKSAGVWRELYLDSLLLCIMPNDRSEVMNIKRNFLKVLCGRGCYTRWQP